MNGINSACPFPEQPIAADQGSDLNKLASNKLGLSDEEEIRAKNKFEEIMKAIGDPEIGDPQISRIKLISSFITMNEMAQGKLSNDQINKIIDSQYEQERDYIGSHFAVGSPAYRDEIGKLNADYILLRQKFAPR